MTGRHASRPRGEQGRGAEDRPVRSGVGALAALAAALLLLPAAAVGQQGGEPSPTPYTATGLGYPTPPVDARAAALGGAGVGLLGGSFSVRNPADLVSFTQASLNMSAAPEAVSVRGPGGEQSSGRARFSVIRAVIPLGAWRASVGFASELDQDWSFRDSDTLEISTGSFPFEERRENDGGISTIDVSVARQVGPLSLGVSYQRLTGELRQALTRRFEVSIDSAIAAPSRVDQKQVWSYGAHRIRGERACRSGTGSG